MPPKPDRETKKAASNLMAMKNKTVSSKEKEDLDKARMPPPSHRPYKHAVRETMAHDSATLEIKNLRAEMKRLEQRNDDIDKKLKEVESKMPSMKDGGMVKKTAPHMLHKGEMVVPAEVAHNFSKLMKKK
jgi:hypothetical protein